MAVQDNISSTYLSAFERPIGVSVQSKLMKWPFLQQMGFAGSLSHANSTFHGLKDFGTQMGTYSSTHPILTAAWKVIKQMVPTNPSVIAKMFISPVLGQVGNEFQSLAGFGEAFAVSPDQLNSPSAISSQLASAQPAASIPFSTKDVV
jgi:hypothetical protein